jgi:predicted Rossmann fold nucleotide-binding protein DprA/Smf involved in DNA uptake
MIYIGIIGSRRRSEKRKIKLILIKERIKHGEITVVSGGAGGIDDDAQWACKELGLRILIIYPNKAEYKIKGNDIYSERNEVVAEISDYMHSFPLHRSGGTMNTIAHFIRLGKRDKLKIYD